MRLKIHCRIHRRIHINWLVHSVICRFVYSNNLIHTKFFKIFIMTYVFAEVGIRTKPPCPWINITEPHESVRVLINNMFTVLRRHTCPLTLRRRYRKKNTETYICFIVNLDLFFCSQYLRPRNVVFGGIFRKCNYVTVNINLFHEYDLFFYFT